MLHIDLRVYDVNCENLHKTFWGEVKETGEEKQARKSSEDAQAAGYARFEKVWAR